MNSNFRERAPNRNKASIHVYQGEEIYIYRRAKLTTSARLRKMNKATTEDAFENKKANTFELFHWNVLSFGRSIRSDKRLLSNPSTVAKLPYKIC